MPWSPWSPPHAPAGLTGRPPYPVLMLLRIHFLQQWFSLSDEGVEDALQDIKVYRAFAGIDLGKGCTRHDSRPVRGTFPAIVARGASSSPVFAPEPASRRPS